MQPLIANNSNQDNGLRVDFSNERDNVLRVDFTRVGTVRLAA